MWRCPNCGSDNPDNANFCGACGCEKTKKTKPVLLTTILVATAIIVVLGLVIWASQTVWHRHKWEEWVEMSPATCESSGREIRFCKGNASHVEERIIPALGHDWEEWVVESQPGCETAGAEVRICRNDTSHREQREIPATGHDWAEWAVERQPCCETAGAEVRTCRKDASHRERREIPALGHDWTSATTEAPQTCRRCGAQVGEKIKTPYNQLMDRVSSYNSGIEHPLKNEMLDSSVTLYVVGAWPNSPSGGMWMCESPGENGIVVLKPHTPVTVHAVRGSLALREGYAFVETGSGEFGWVNFKATRGTGVGLTDTNDFSYSY